MPWIDLSPLPIDKIVTLQRFARERDPGLLERIDVVFDHLAELNPARAKGILAARIDSPVLEDRTDIAGGYQLYDLIKVDYEGGVELLSRIMRDRSPDVRFQARHVFTDSVGAAVPGGAGEFFGGEEVSPLELVKHADELKLHERTGLFRPEAERLARDLASPTSYDPGLQALQELQAATSYTY